MKRFQIMLPEPMMKKLREISVEKGVSVSELIRRSMDLYIESLDRKDFEDLLRLQGKL